MVVVTENKLFYDRIPNDPLFVKVKRIASNKNLFFSVYVETSMKRYKYVYVRDLIQRE